jgi:hypothetical protein
MRIRITELFDSFTSAELATTLANADTVEILIPDEAYNVVSSYIDVTQSLLEISWLVESIATDSQIIKGVWVERQTWFRDFSITLKPFNTDKLADFILRYSKFFSEENETDEADEKWRYEQLSDYEENLYSFKPYFHDLLDSYYSNLIGGAYYEMAENSPGKKKNFYKKEYEQYPERKHNFWKSPFSLKYGATIYMTLDPGPWVFSVDLDVNNVIKSYFGEEERSWQFEAARMVDYKGRYIAFNSQNAIWFDGIKELAKAKRLIPKVAPDGSWIRRPVRNVGENKFFISDFGDLFIVQDELFNYVFFQTEAGLKYEEIIELRNDIDSKLLSAEKLIGIEDTETIDWSRINDDTFEELCYDIIYNNPRFDRSTIRKMGKSRSRDGGRDIEVYTYADNPKEKAAELYIFQCKFLRRKTSLTGSKMPGLANTLMQYGAKGYGVFTTGVIDSTLYDLLSGIQSNMNVSTKENWSIYEIERYLTRNKPLMKKFFP